MARILSTLAIALALVIGADLAHATYSGNGPFLYELLDSGGTNKASVSAAGALKVDGSAATQPVTCVSGCSATTGTGASNSDAVATATTGLAPGENFLYGYNGTTWDRLRVDGNKNLDVTLGTALPAGSATIGAVSQSGTWNIGSISSLPALPANQSVNLSQVGGSAVATGTGASGAGVPRVTVSNDSLMKLWDGTHTAAINSSGAVQVNGGIADGTALAGLLYSPISAANSGGASKLISCNNSVVYDASTSGATSLISPASGQTVYVCGYSIVSAGTASVKLESGTGALCGTGTVAMTPAYELTAQGGIADGSPFFRGMKSQASAGVCFSSSAAVAVQAIVYYTQF